MYKNESKNSNPRNWQKMLQYLIGEEDMLLARDTATIEETMTTISATKNHTINL